MAEFALAIAGALLLSFSMVASAADSSTHSQSPRLQKIVDLAVAETVTQFNGRKLEPSQLAVTLIDLQRPEEGQGSHRGGEKIYPASVIKLFYLAAAHRWMEDGRLQDSAELRRAMSDMIVHSYNEATHYVIDVLTETTSGPELSQTEIEEWWNKRNAVNRYFTSQGFVNINANKKPWCEGPYGRETQAIKLFEPKRNQLTTDATARLLKEIVTLKSISAQRSSEMMKLLARDPFTKSNDNDSQATGFTGMGLPAGSKLWSKAGWTSQTRHDAAYIELSTGEKFILVTFTTDHANERQIIPSVAKVVIREMTKR